MAPERQKEKNVKWFLGNPMAWFKVANIFLTFESVMTWNPVEVLHWNNGSILPGLYNLNKSCNATKGQMAESKGGKVIKAALSLDGIVFDHFTSNLTCFDSKKYVPTCKMARGVKIYYAMGH